MNTNVFHLLQRFDISVKPATDIEMWQKNIYRKYKLTITSSSISKPVIGTALVSANSFKVSFDSVYDFGLFNKAFSEEIEQNFSEFFSIYFGHDVYFAKDGKNKLKLSLTDDMQSYATATSSMRFNLETRKRYKVWNVNGFGVFNKLIAKQLKDLTTIKYSLHEVSFPKINL